MKKLLIFITVFMIVLSGLVMAETSSVDFNKSNNAADITEEDLKFQLHIIKVLIGILILCAILLIYQQKKFRKKTIQIKDRYENLFKNMKEGVALHEIICDDNGKPVDYRFLEVNQSFETITCLRESDIKNRTVKEVLPDTENHWIEKYGEVALKGTTICLENFSKELNKYFSVNVYSPEINYFITVFTDITKQVEARENTENDRKLLESILEDTLSGYWDMDFENNTEYMSPAFKRMLGYSQNELESFFDTFIKLINKEDLPYVLEKLDVHVQSRGKVPFYNEIRYHHKNGNTVWVISSGRVVEWTPEGKPKRMIGCHIDITQMKQLEEKLLEERAKFKTTLLSIGDAVITSDLNGKIDLMNSMAERLTGWAANEAKGISFETVFNIINENTRESIKSPIKHVLATEKTIELANQMVLIKKDGNELPIENSAAPIKDFNGNILGAVVVFRDFTEKKEKQEKIAFLSFHDQLTGLYNRRFFEEELYRLDTKRNLPFTIIMMDVNGLKLTNDAFGHQMGDNLLKTLAKILKDTCRNDDIISRIGGDEFVILLPETDHDVTEQLVKRIYSAISVCHLENIIISVSIGWETKYSVDQELTEVLKKAEEHMYRRKLTESQSMRNETIKVIFKTLHQTSEREKIHSENVSKISRKIGEVMNLDQVTLKELEVAGLMHDIGKIAINHNILNKEDKLTDKEYAEIKRHPEIGYHILKSVDEYSELAEYVLSHHERWDGKGYPRGLSKEEIPLLARIITVADAYDAMTADRPYKKATSKKIAIKELENCSGTQFDPDIVNFFKQLNYHLVK